MFQPKSPESIEAAHAAQSVQSDPAVEARDLAQDDGEETPEHEHVEPDTDDEAGSVEEVEVTDDAAQGDEWVVPGKFRTVQDLATAYHHAEQQLGRLHRELAELKRLQSTPQQQIDDKEKQIADAERNREILRAFLRDPQGTLQREAMRIQQEQQQQLAQRAAVVHRAIFDVSSRYSDFAELQGQVSQYIATRPAMQRLLQQLQADPNVTQEDFADLLDTAYHAVRAQTANEALAAAREQGRQEAQASTQARKRAKGVAQGAKRGHEPSESYEDRARREILEAGPPRGIFG